MKKIGLIGGLSWVSTAAYYQLLNEMMQEKLGGVASAWLVLESVNRQEYVDAVITREDDAAACEQILNAAKSVEHAGADFIVISCNDVHRFVPEIESHINIPFLHIAHASAKAIKKMKLDQVALLGVKKTMEGIFYPQILSQYGVTTHIPNAPERDYIHGRIYDQLVLNIFEEETRIGYLEIIETLRSRGAQGVVLGCTEIPLLLSPEQIPMPSFSTTQLHCAAAIEMALDK